MNELEVKSTEECIKSLRDEVLRFRNPFSKHLGNQLSDLFDRAYDAIRNVYIDESNRLLMLRITAKTAIEEVLILNKNVVNSNVKQYKQVLLSALNEYLTGIHNVVPENSPA